MANKKPCKNDHWLCQGPYTEFGFFCCPKCNTEFFQLLNNKDKKAVELAKTLNLSCR